MNSGSRIWAENLGQSLSRDVCHQLELETNNLIFTLQTFNYFEASCLAMDTLCNFHGNRDISRLALELCGKLCVSKGVSF